MGKSTFRGQCDQAVRQGHARSRNEFAAAALERDLAAQEPANLDRRTQDAVLRRLETLADASSHLSDVIKARHSEIPWHQISDFRDVLAHGTPTFDSIGCGRRLKRIWAYSRAWSMKSFAAPARHEQCGNTAHLSEGGVRRGDVYGARLDPTEGS